MSQFRLPPPERGGCLDRPDRSTSQRGGTLIAEDVTDLAGHLVRLANAELYRPEACARADCRGDTLHVHDRRERKLRAEPAHGQPQAGVTLVMVFICAACDATWRILPLFIARRLWRSWRVVERATLGPAPLASAPKVPARTVSRWRARLASSARHGSQLLATSGSLSLLKVAQDVGLGATREELIRVHAAAASIAPGARLAHLAALFHRLARGSRLM